MLRDLLKRFRHRVPELRLDIEALRNIYKILISLRRDLVDSFDALKDRRLREVYDTFSFMMLHYDKLLQFLRRLVNAPLYDDTKLRISEIENLITQLPLELSMKMRSLVSYVQMLKNYSYSASSNYIKNLVFDIDNVIESIANDISGVLG